MDSPLRELLSLARSLACWLLRVSCTGVVRALWCVRESLRIFYGECWTALNALLLLLLLSVVCCLLSALRRRRPWSRWVPQSHKVTGCVEEDRGGGGVLEAPSARWRYAFETRPEKANIREIDQTIDRSCRRTGCTLGSGWHSPRACRQHSHPPTPTPTHTRTHTHTHAHTPPTTPASRVQHTDLLTLSFPRRDSQATNSESSISSLCEQSQR